MKCREGATSSKCRLHVNFYLRQYDDIGSLFLKNDLVFSSFINFVRNLYSRVLNALAQTSYTPKFKSTARSSLLKLSISLEIIYKRALR